MIKNLLILLCILLCFNKIHSQTNWELLNPKPTTNTGKDIVFSSSNTGYIITSNELLETIDSGISWQKKQDITSGNDINFHNNIGFIVGNGGYILKSTNSGASWEEISTGFTNSFNTVNVIDENNIILSTSNSIIKSNDGGANWQSLNIPDVLVHKTFFTNSEVGHAACDNGTMLKTIDGGENWYITQYSNTTGDNFYTVYFVNENVGFASIEHSDLFKTTDGGETWVEVPGIIDEIYSIYFLNENTGYFTGDDGVVFKTLDGGNTWTWASFQNNRIFGTTMYGIYFEDVNIGYVTGNGGRIFRTIDGGDSWIQHSPTYNNLNHIQFLDNNIGYTQTRGNFYKTTDSGNTWDFLSTLNLFSTEYDSHFTFVNENIGYAATIESGNVVKTTDGGITWSVLNNGYELIDEGITSIFFIDENNGFISGGYNFGKVIKTTDGGLSWTQVESLTFEQIQFLNSQVGYAHRKYGGTMYKTIDGGNTWNISIEVDDSIESFHFLDENNGYFVGPNSLIYKTTDGGTTWQEFPEPYLRLEQVKFYSKNVGYVSDYVGRLYKTMNGGESWEYLTQQNYINSIELIDDKIYTAGTNGKIYRSDIEFDPVALHINEAENISNSSVTLTGNVTSNEGAVSNIQFEFSTDNTFNNIISTNPNSISSYESLNVLTELSNLDPFTTYFFRLKGTYNSIEYTSQVLNFTTFPDYEIWTSTATNSTLTTTEVSGYIISNEHDVTNVEFQYGTSADELFSISIGTPTIVMGNTSESITATLNDLQPDTEYFYRLKATYQGEDIYGNIRSFTSYPEYDISLYNPTINGTDVTLSAFIISNNQEIFDIKFEYGSIDYENNISANPQQINANSYASVNATISNLDTNLDYYYRVKATHNGVAIYSEEGVFNFSEDIIMVSGTIVETELNSLELKGLINSYGAYLSNIHFEYGITESFGLSIDGTPNFVDGYNNNVITGLIYNPLPNQTYFYRLVATYNGNTIYSETYQYRTGTLSIEDLSMDKQISIFPNPATDFVKIKSNTFEKIYSLEFYDAIGKLVYFQNIRNDSDLIIEISNFRKGIYFLKVNFESNKTITSKIILN